MKSYADYIRDYKNALNKIGIVFPVSASIDVTKLCNLNCKHCYNKVVDKENTFFDYNNITKFIKNFDIKEITLCGGEPFIFSKLPYAIEKIKENNIGINILTNGILVDSRVQQNLQEILDWKDTIQISCDDVFGEFSQRNMMSSQERQLIKNIRLLSKSSINYHVNITPTVYNQNKILDIVKQLINLGVKKIGFTSYVPFGGKVSDMLKPNYSLLKNVEEEVTKLCKKNEITLSGELKGHPCEVDVNILKTIKKTYTVYSCEAGKYNIHINQKGEIYP